MDVKKALQEVLDYFDIDPKGHSGASTGMKWLPTNGEELASYSPIDGSLIGTVKQPTQEYIDEVVEQARKTFEDYWRMVPAPKRGELVREIADEVRKHKEMLARLITIEMGKIIQESRGEVQEWIDMCDFAVGLSRQLYGLTIASERYRHRLYEQWHPLGPVGIITAFNFPMAVWSWNAMIALVCGDTTIWKPASATPFCTIAVQKVVGKVLERHGLPEGIVNVLVGSSKYVGDNFLADSRIPLISFTGSVEAGRHAYQIVAKRLGRTILELGGNNAAIITPSADLGLALRAVTFGAVGTAGQRCTTLRRLILHESIYDQFLESLVNVYKQLKIGNPLDENVHVGPLVSEESINTFFDAIKRGKEEGGKLIYGGEHLTDMPSNLYVRPAIMEIDHVCPVTCEETFAPLLYVHKYRDIEEAIALNNAVPQGLSSAIFTNHLKEAELFLSPIGSDCGIANVNTSTSGAEIGGAFGGEKETGGGREAGSDAWKAYMRRQTVTINWADDLPLAQGIKFEI